MKRETITFRWEDEAAQEVFREWVPFPNAQASARDVDRIENLLSLSAPLDVLDVGCGNGRHAIEMASRGYRVTAIDVAKRYLDEARELAAKFGVDVEFRQQRASELSEIDAYDFALAYWHTIGFMSDEEIRKHFRSIRTALKPGCVLLYVFQGPKLLTGAESANTQPVKSWSEKDGKFILSEKSIRDGYRNEYCVIIDTNAGSVTKFEEHQKAMTYADVMDYLTGAEFASVAAYSDFEKTPAGAEDFYIFVCRK